jgi:hypothetical protein
MALGEVYELTLKTTQAGQQMANVFYFQELSTFAGGLPNPAEACASAFFAQYLPKIRAITNPQLNYLMISCRSLWTDSFKHDILLTGNGTGTGNFGGEALSTFLAIGFKMRGNNPAVKVGFKRFAGIGEGVNANGVVNLIGGEITAMTALKTQMSTNLMDTLTTLIPWFAPAIIKRVRTGVPGNYVYRLPAEPGETIVSVIVEAAWQLLLTSQTSRKVGVGS